MFRRHCDSWQDIRDLDEPGVFRNQCKTLLDQIINFTHSEAPIYGQASKTDVEKQDVSYKLLEEENLMLRDQIMSLQQTIESKIEEISDLKSRINQFKCNKQDEPCVEEVSLPDVKNIIKRINSTIEDIIDSDSTEGLGGTILSKKPGLNLETTDSHVMCDNILDFSSADVLLLNDDRTFGEDDVVPSKSSSTNDSPIRGSKSNLTDTGFRTSKEENFLTLEENYFSLKSENLTLQDRIKTLTDRVTLLKSSLKSCELELVQYDKILSLIKQERFNLISELRETKHCYNALKLRNEYLEEKVEELENRLKPETSPDVSQREEEDDCSQIEILNCYKSRLYEAFKEMSMKEEQIGQLNDSINGLVEKFKVEKSSLEMEYADHLKGSEDRLKRLCEEKVKLEETIRQQSKLIDHLQTMVESREKKHNSKINCIKDY